ncbi:terminase [Heyndrickxia ginsengihumi]|uniref:Terminase n=1 Tax=Heyndrickxia ginsengihumi TaxID=363870 RepID=A0A0A6Y280_9BACI|nr:terminase small subunit [Heyndrickxia ginsengihumi]KHD86362.1 terminase [Heyndrickxia ginsengihumi]
MPRKRDPKRDEAFELYKDSEGEAKLKDIADQLGVAEGTVRGWKNKDKWDQKLNGTFQKKIRNVPNKSVPKKARAPDEEVTLDNFLQDAGLTEKQRLFCLYYVRSFNATQSAINAGYSPATAHVQGPRLLGNVRVREEIKRIKGAMTNELFIEAMDVLNKYIKIAFSDITDYLEFGQREVPVMNMFGPVKDEDGNIVMKEVNYVDFKESGLVDGTIISEVKQGKDGVSIKLEDRKWALDKLAQYFDLFPDNFKRKIQEEKNKLKREEVAIKREEIAKKNAPPEKPNINSYIEALKGRAAEVWNDEE